MAAHVIVTDFTLQQRKIAVDASKTLSDVRNEACTRMKGDPSNYGLKYKNKFVDLSRTFRQSGLSSGAKLELVAVSKSPSVVSVALQHADNTRQVEKVPSTTTLWLLLRKFEETGKDKNIHITDRSIAQMDGASSGWLFYEAPVLRIMNKEYTEFEDLQKTLAQIGINSGTVLINLRYRKTETPLEKAMQEIGQYFQVKEIAKNFQEQAKEAEQEEAASRPLPHSSPNSRTPPAQARQKIPPKSASPGPQGRRLSTTERKVQVFAAPTSSTPAAASVDMPDSAYEPSIADLQRLKNSLASQATNRRLLSDAETAEQETEKAARKAVVRETTVKIRFPDETSVTFKVTQEDTGRSLYEFVRGLVVDSKQPFWLVYRGKTPNERLEDSDRVHLIRDAGFSGPTLVNFVWADGASDAARKQPALQQEYRQQAKPIPVPEIVKEQMNAKPDVEQEAGPSEKPQKPKDTRSKEERLMALMGKGKLFGKK